MLVLVEHRELVMDGFRSLFKREGVCVTGLAPDEFRDWFATLPEAETAMIEAVLIGDCAARPALMAQVAQRLDVPVFALLDGHRLEETLRLLDHGFDDVLRKPVHVREILARIGLAARRRTAMVPAADNDDEVRVYLDGREPLVSHGSPMPVYGDFFEGDDTAMKTPSGQPLMRSSGMASVSIATPGCADSAASSSLRVPIAAAISPFPSAAAASPRLRKCTTLARSAPSINWSRKSLAWLSSSTPMRSSANTAKLSAAEPEGAGTRSATRARARVSRW